MSTLLRGIWWTYSKLLLPSTFKPRDADIVSVGSSRLEQTKRCDRFGRPFKLAEMCINCSLPGLKMIFLLGATHGQPEDSLSVTAVHRQDLLASCRTG